MTPLSFFSAIKLGLALVLGALISWSVPGNGARARVLARPGV